MTNDVDSDKDKMEFGAAPPPPSPLYSAMGVVDINHGLEHRNSVQSFNTTTDDEEDENEELDSESEYSSDDESYLTNSSIMSSSTSQLPSEITPSASMTFLHTTTSMGLTGGGLGSDDSSSSLASCSSRIISPSNSIRNSFSNSEALSSSSSLSPERHKRNSMIDLNSMSPSSSKKEEKRRKKEEKAREKSKKKEKHASPTKQSISPSSTVTPNNQKLRTSLSSALFNHKSGSGGESQETQSRSPPTPVNNTTCNNNNVNNTNNNNALAASTEKKKTMSFFRKSPSSHGLSEDAQTGNGFTSSSAYQSRTNNSQPIDTTTNSPHLSTSPTTYDKYLTSYHSPKKKTSTIEKIFGGGKKKDERRLGASSELQPQAAQSQQQGESRSGGATPDLKSSSSSINKIRMSVSENDLLNPGEMTLEEQARLANDLANLAGLRTVVTTSSEATSLVASMPLPSIREDDPAMNPLEKANSEPMITISPPLEGDGQHHHLPPHRATPDRQLMRRKTIEELKFDTTLKELVASKGQELKRYKQFIGTRPAYKTKLFQSEEETPQHSTLVSRQSSIEDMKNGNVNIDCSTGWTRECDIPANLIRQRPAGSSQHLLEESDNEIHHYDTSFLDFKHKNFLSVDQLNGGPIGPVIISIRKVAEKFKQKKKRHDKPGEGAPPMMAQERRFKVLVRTQEGEDRFYLSSGKATPQELMHTVQSICQPISALTFKVIKSNDVKKQLSNWEDKLITKDYTFGLLYRKKDQLTESEMFSNQIQDASEEYNEFLEFIGKKIELKDWPHYKGNLDIVNNSTGIHSVYTTKHFNIDDNIFKFQIMFHVSTLLPFRAHDEQQLERKRHVGNDVVVLIFQDIGCAPFVPSTIRSEFNHVFIVVQPQPKQSPLDPTQYIISVTSKDGVGQFGPSFSPNKVWKKDINLLDSLIAKMINGAKAALYANAFSEKLKKTRLAFLKAIISKIDQ
ncbi:hypothetical protein SAMD00019534_079310 [Acytostelium subglobosum LB1]|uniref:hypothetical protein n=1 Tax=Acytostelium subglobosum LB1 TaxID=1410327 RepID=UPI000644BC9C|nr:hypothetical protein SAMD00019534_079310 [Acytostelium subglobosum LB1]GAM24756.1 hypothetical protein SAMD00019534_079310 [Acytostelium subglobosum LB1]|eukprot:XP_012752425.1 hypothetical protein SAMD00019534_079310 [Acytostelium subglobosum LB1]